MEKNVRVVQEMDESCKIVVGCAVGVTGVDEWERWDCIKDRDCCLGLTHETRISVDYDVCR